MDAINNFRNNNTEMFTTLLLMGFSDLLVHRLHNQEKVLIHCNHPDATIEDIDLVTLPKRVSEIILIAYAASHYAVIQIDLESEIIIITDGLFWGVNSWRKYIVHTLLKYKIVKRSILQTHYKSRFAFGTSLHKKTYDAMNNKQFIVEQNTHVIQGSDLHCGPHAAYEIYTILNDHKGITRITDGVSKRIFVMDLYSKMIKEGQNENWLRYRSQTLLINQFDDTEDNQHFEVHGSDSDNNDGTLIEVITSKKNKVSKTLITSPLLAAESDSNNNDDALNDEISPKKNKVSKPLITSPLLTAVKKRSIAVQSSIEGITLRNKRMTAINVAVRCKSQSKQSTVMKKRYEQSVSDVNLKLGDFVRITVPPQCRYRAFSHPIIGVVYFLSKKKIPYVITENGIVGNKNNNPITMKLSEFDIVNARIDFGNTINLYREFIISSTYEPKVKFFWKGLHIQSFPLATLHAKMNPKENQSSHICKCKINCDSAKCTCRANETKCGIGCNCKGKCTYTLDMV